MTADNQQQAPSSPSPARIYAGRLKEQSDRITRLERRDRQFSLARLGTILLSILFAGLAVILEVIPAWLVLLPLASFVGLIIVHERGIVSLERARRVAEFLTGGLARLDGSWVGLGAGGERFRESGHPYADDLDLFGSGSLFQFLNIARTAAGQHTLAGWLQHGADPRTVRERQQALLELRDRLDLREDLALLGQTLSTELHPDALKHWADEPEIRFPAAARWITFGFNLVVLAAAASWALGWTGWVPLLGAYVLQSAFGMLLRTRVNQVITATELRLRDLGLLSRLLARLERESFHAPYLAKALGALEGGELLPSGRIRKLHRLVSALDWRRNMLFAPVAFSLLWNTHFAMRIEAWRVRHGRAVGSWLSAVGEFEALSCLACFAFEHPENLFPEILEGPEPVFDGTGLGHPLIPDEECITNDLSLGSQRRLLVISGSNMSGKSTMLRTVGITAVLALAGSPVRATRLRLSCLTLGASIRVSDSLQDGASRFYTEIRRLRQIFDLLAEGSGVLFLLDELLQGTNSHDRLIGAEAVVKGLLERGALGLLTTHDLALTEMTSRLGPHAENVHFQDQMVDGEIHFDYSMRPGVVQHSNALALMRAVGLEV